MIDLRLFTVEQLDAIRVDRTSRHNAVLRMKPGSVIDRVDAIDTARAEELQATDAYFAAMRNRADEWEKLLAERNQ